MSAPTHLSQSLDWLIKTISDVTTTKTSFEISSFVRTFSGQDIFNQEFYKEQKIKYPFVAYQLKSGSLSANTRLGSAISQKRGQSLANITFNTSGHTSVDYIVDSTKERIKKASLWPIDVEILLTFVTNTPQQFEEFFLAWFELYPQTSGFIPFENDTQLPVTLTPIVEGIDFPDKETDEKGDIYKGDFSVTLWTYAGSVTDVSAVKAAEAAQSAPLDIGILIDKNGNTVSNVVKISPRR